MEGGATGPGRLFSLWGGTAPIAIRGSSSDVGEELESGDEVRLVPGRETF